MRFMPARPTHPGKASSLPRSWARESRPRKPYNSDDDNIPCLNCEEHNIIDGSAPGSPPHRLISLLHLTRRVRTLCRHPRRIVTCLVVSANSHVVSSLNTSLPHNRVGAFRAFAQLGILLGTRVGTRRWETSWLF